MPISAFTGATYRVRLTGSLGKNAPISQVPRSVSLPLKGKDETSRKEREEEVGLFSSSFYGTENATCVALLLRLLNFLPWGLGEDISFEWEIPNVC